MRVEWYGQSTFGLTTPEARVVIDPFGDMAGRLAPRGMRWEYPPLVGVEAELVLVTHEHADHNGVEAVGGDPLVLRSRAGRFESPVGEVVAVASEHDAVAGTERGDNTILVFELGGLRVAHFGDFGQDQLRDAQAAAIGSVDLAFVPVGGSATIGGAQAVEIAARVGARWIVPMHYRTSRIDFLEPADDFLARVPATHALDEPAFETGALPDAEGLLAVVPSAP